MNKRLSWNQISDLYSGYWVELVDFEWDWSRAYPEKARIRNVSPNRTSLMATIRTQGEIENSVVLFVGNTRSLIGSRVENHSPHVTL